MTIDFQPSSPEPQSNFDFQPISGQTSTPVNNPFNQTKPEMPDTSGVIKTVNDNSKQEPQYNPDAQPPSFAQKLDKAVGAPLSSSLGKPDNSCEMSPAMRKLYSDALLNGTTISPTDWLQSTIHDVAQAIEPEPWYQKAGESALTAVNSFLKGATEDRLGFSAHPYQDLPPNTTPKDYSDKLIAQGPAEGWNKPDWWIANAAHAIGSNASMLGGMAAGAGIGTMTPVPGGALVFGALGAMFPTYIKGLKENYLNARSQGLAHDDAVERSISESRLDAAFAGLSTLFPEIKFFGKTLVKSGENFYTAAKKPISEFLAQTVAAQPAVGAAQEETKAHIEDRQLSLNDVFSMWVKNLAGGAATAGVAKAHGGLSGIIEKNTGKPADTVTQQDVDAAAHNAYKGPAISEFNDVGSVMGVDPKHLVKVYSETGKTPLEMHDDAAANPHIQKDLEDGKIPLDYDHLRGKNLEGPAVAKPVPPKGVQYTDMEPESPEFKAHQKILSKMGVSLEPYPKEETATPIPSINEIARSINPEAVSKVDDLQRQHEELSKQLIDETQKRNEAASEDKSPYQAKIEDLKRKLSTYQTEKNAYKYQRDLENQLDLAKAWALEQSQKITPEMNRIRQEQENIREQMGPLLPERSSAMEAAEKEYEKKSEARRTGFKPLKAPPHKENLESEHGIPEKMSKGQLMTVGNKINDITQNKEKMSTMPKEQADAVLDFERRIQDAKIEKFRNQAGMKGAINILGQDEYSSKEISDAVKKDPAGFGAYAAARKAVEDYYSGKSKADISEASKTLSAGFEKYENIFDAAEKHAEEERNRSIFNMGTLKEKPTAEKKVEDVKPMKEVPAIKLGQEVKFDFNDGKGEVSVKYEAGKLGEKSSLYRTKTGEDGKPERQVLAIDTESGETGWVSEEEFKNRQDAYSQRKFGNDELARKYAERELSKVQDEARQKSLESVRKAALENTPQHKAKGKSFASNLYDALKEKLGQDKETDSTSFKKEAEGRKALGRNLSEKLYLHKENSKIELTPKEQELWNKWVKSGAEKERSLYERLSKLLGDKTGEEFGLSNPNEDYVHRIRKGMGGYLDNPYDSETGVGQDAGLSKGPRLTQTASGIKEAQFHTLEDDNGNREFQLGAIPEGKNVGDKITKDGKEYIIKRAWTSEIEDKTDIKYHKDIMSSIESNNRSMEKAIRNIEFLNSMKDSLEKSGLGYPPGSKDVPPRYKELLIPQLRGWSFDKRIAEVLQDVYDRGDPTVFQDINNMLIKGMFINPVPHVENVLYDYLVSRGWKNFTPDIKGTKYLADGWKDVSEYSDLYRDVLKNGGALQLPSVWKNSFYLDMAKQFTKEAQQSKEGLDLAKSWGFDSVPQMTEAMFNGSQKAMWGAGDAMLMARIRELMDGGQDIKGAIKEAQKHMIDYAVPPRVGEEVFNSVFKSIMRMDEGKAEDLSAKASRSLSKTLSSSGLLVFSRYHYGLMKSMSNMIRDISVGTKEEKIAAAGQAFSMAFLLHVVNPVISAAIGAVTGEDEELKASGVTGLLNVIEKVATGSQKVGDAIKSQFIPSPVFKAGLDLMDGNMIKWGEGHIPIQILDYIMKQPTMSVPAMIYHAAEGKDTIGQEGLKQLGVHKPYVPSEKSKRWQERQDKYGAKKLADEEENLGSSF